VIDTEISTLIESPISRAIAILEENKDKLNQLADILIEKLSSGRSRSYIWKRTFDKNLEVVS
jgi:cell division protease FtsH